MKFLTATLLSLCFLAFVPLANAGMLTGKVELDGPANKEGIVVYLKGITGKFRSPGKRPQIDHKDQNFSPTSLVIMKGTTVEFPNSDEVFHSAFSISQSNPFDLGIYGPGNDQNVTFSNPGLTEVFCHIHDHMYAFILVVDNPFFTTVGEGGDFSIPNIPEGTYQVSAWTAPRHYVTKTVKINAKKSSSASFTLKTE